MSWILYDYRCVKCSHTFEALNRRGDPTPLCTNCQSKTKIKPSFKAVHGADSFNPHYDIQLGKFFESAEHKEKILKAEGRSQLSGTPSPKKSRKDRLIMSKGQYLKGVKRRELLTQRPKTQGA